MKKIFAQWFDFGRKIEPNHNQDKTVFGFIFQHLESFLLIGMAFLIYALFNTFTSHIAENAVFIKEPSRLEFAQTLIFGLMAVEVLLALATSYFRKRNEWAKSIIVTVVAFIIAYYNHETIGEIFKALPNTSQAVKLKLMLCNWLIFGLGEIVSLLMNSKGQDQEPGNIPEWFSNFIAGTNTILPGQTIAGQEAPGVMGDLAPTGRTKIGFEIQAKSKAHNEPLKVKNWKPRGKSVNYTKIYDCLDKGMTVQQTALACKTSESTIQRAKRERKAQNQ